MYTKEIIDDKFSRTEKREMKYYLLSHALLEVILEKPREETSEKEYLEALIFSSFMITQRMKHSIGFEETKEFMAMEISKYIAENYELEDFIRSISSEIYPFVITRFNTIEEEISELNYGSGYQLPLLINNLYINPTNNSDSTIDEVMQNMGLKMPIVFKTKLKHFLTVLESSIKSFESNNY